MEEKVLTAIKEACPRDCKVSVCKTARSVNLIIIDYRYTDVDIDEWTIERVYPLNWEIGRKITNPGDYRLLYCCGNKFVFYSPFEGVFSGFDDLLNYEVFDNEFQHKYVGECREITNLVTYFKKREECF